MAFTKNSLFTFLKIAAFLFLMAFAFVAYNKADSSEADFRQSAIYQKTSAALTDIFSWAGALADLNLGRNIIPLPANWGTAARAGDSAGQLELYQRSAINRYGSIAGEQLIG